MGKCKVFYRSEFYTHKHEIHQSEPENYSLTICIHTKLIYGTVFEIWSNLCRKVAPPENPENKPKSEISLSQLLNIRNIQNLPLDICLCGWRNAMQLVKKNAYHQRRQNPRWSPIMVKKSFSVSGKQQDTKIMKFNSHPYTLSLQYPSYSKFS